MRGGRFGLAARVLEENRRFGELLVDWTTTGSTSGELMLSGDTVKAKSADSDLLTLWKSADRDIPVLKEAWAEYARLQ